jgi:beta-aspartyl-peptidase (threonine type)
VTPAIAVHGGAGSVDQEGRDQRLIVLAAARDAGGAVLSVGGSAIDAVTEAVCVLEDAPIFNAGTGSVLTWDGEIEMDASIMADGDAFGAVGALRVVRHPVRAARAVMEETDHWLLCGEGALAFVRAHAWGAGPWDPETPERRARWRVLREEVLRAARDKGSLDDPALARRERLVPFLRAHPAVAGTPGTVGAVAIDREGRTAAATSTGGIWLKLTGRVGDSALPGAGTFVGPGGAISATGHGEAIVRVQVARRAEALLRTMDAPAAAARAVEEASGGGCVCGLIAVDRRGSIGFAFNTAAMPVEVGRG